MVENALKMDDLRVFQRFPFYGNPPYHHRSARVFQISTASQALGTLSRFAGVARREDYANYVNMLRILKEEFT